MYIHKAKPPHTLTFNVTDIKGSVLQSCENSLALSLMTSRANLKMWPSHAELITSSVDCQDVNKLQAYTTGQQTVMGKYAKVSVSQAYEHILQANVYKPQEAVQH